MTKPIVPVLFRVWRNDREVFALFPTFPGTNERHTCTCYVHVGQHHSVGESIAIASSRPAKPDEYKDLLRELAQIYDDCTLRVMQRASRKMQLERYALLRGDAP